MEARKFKIENDEGPFMESDTFYHYCSNETFVNIFREKRIRLSSLLLSNDSTEGKLAGDLLAKQIRKDTKNAWKADHAEELLEVICAGLGGYGFSLSEGEDLLSQWRGYAQDGQGVAVGFSRTFLESLSSENIDFKNVEYDPIKQDGIVKELLFQKMTSTSAIEHAGGKYQTRSLLDGWNPDHVEQKDDLGRGNADDFQQCLTKAEVHRLLLQADVFRLKHKSFFEEQEWRLLKNTAKGVVPKFIGRGAHVRSYVECAIPASKTPVAEIVVGPKNVTPHYVIQQVLKENGYDDVPIHPSKIPYQ